MIVVDSVTDLNKLILSFTVQKDPSGRFEHSKKSINLIFQLIDHRGEGSLFQCLKALNYVVEIETDTSDCLQTAFRLFTIEIELTETGLQNY